ncbi:DUF4044 domain-containing protein [Companilactobacillus pabuli]|uniref:DUF4044 domain-containing protein n=2 Tax=Companilactobacillus TaxID=2767879 RepID=A0A386PRK4_9LACO|nr:MULTISPECIES: DUF4044 domain-containing protein [Companilactobacillus]MCV3763821.1 DUF4044 domain-containing protein [Companilactobacillus farciminis]AYE37992.1 DUF4044 domain-containing protein [Companilactobacillus zhachilii]MBL3530326.1 DUF4044 domain-containing protein [Companilactobacillus zhachilii]MDG5113394.1 DUF4044 domain-containing protein [Companilactobacillus pabuli]QMT83811.1 DUF4044 domain-containing protein [Companilactobacillus pabuli]
MDDKKPKSTLTKITQVVVWLMILVTIGGVVLGAVMSFI